MTMDGWFKVWFRNECSGLFQTKVEAAVAYARAATGEEDAAAERDAAAEEGEKEEASMATMREHEGYRLVRELHALHLDCSYRSLSAGAEF